MSMRPIRAKGDYKTAIKEERSSYGKVSLDILDFSNGLNGTYKFLEMKEYR